MRAVWVCEYGDCGHVWLAVGEAAPVQCARCRRRGWHERENVPAKASGPKPERITAAITTVIDSPEQVSQLSARPGHDPKTCRVYRCGACAGLGHKDARRGLG